MCDWKTGGGGMMMMMMMKSKGNEKVLCYLLDAEVIRGVSS